MAKAKEFEFEEPLPTMDDEEKKPSRPSTKALLTRKRDALFL
jgi:hypothetical protein